MRLLQRRSGNRAKTWRPRSRSMAAPLVLRTCFSLRTSEAWTWAGSGGWKHQRHSPSQLLSRLGWLSIAWRYIWCTFAAAPWSDSLFFFSFFNRMHLRSKKRHVLFVLKNEIKQICARVWSTLIPHARSLPGPARSGPSHGTHSCLLGLVLGPVGRGVLEGILQIVMGGRYPGEASQESSTG